MIVTFASEEWYAQVKELADKSKNLKRAAADWEGTVRCVITMDREVLKDYTKEEKEENVRGFISMLAMMSAEQRAKYEGTPFGNLMKQMGYPMDVDVETISSTELTKAFSKLTMRDLKGVETYVIFELRHGILEQLGPIAPDEHEDARFTLRGKYASWKTLCMGKQSTIQLVMSGKMRLQGDMSYMMRHMDAVNALMKLFTQIELTP